MNDVGVLAVAVLCAIEWFETTAEMPWGEAAICGVKGTLSLAFVRLFLRHKQNAQC
jgi:hypothetical protein